MDIVFFGSGAFGVPTLAALAERHRLVAVVSQPDRRAGRGDHDRPTPCADWAEAPARGIRVLKPERVNEPRVVAEIRAFRADAWVVVAFGQKLSASLLDGVLAINLHGSLLPRWRGAAPINAAVLAGDAESGNSVITLADRMDAGLVLGRSRRVIDPMQTAGELHDQLAADGPVLIEDALSRHAAGTLRGEVQDESLVTLAPKLSKIDAWVDFAASPVACQRRVHGLTPWPGVTVGFRGQPLKLLRVKPAGGLGEPPGGTVSDPHLGLISCGAGLLSLLEVQAAGKRPMTWDAFARGARVRKGEVLGAWKP
ncbi:MAG: methionyl-tRNA formyltransferase [Phycisphaerales bacterium]|nr:methionyl-tRNA formyltransferase [Phycisphaerales bacterium]